VLKTLGNTSGDAQTVQSILAHAVQGAEQHVATAACGACCWQHSGACLLPTLHRTTVPVEAEAATVVVEAGVYWLTGWWCRSVRAAVIRMMSTLTDLAGTGAVESNSQAWPGLDVKGGVMCLYRITVQGTPTDTGSFC